MLEPVFQALDGRSDLVPYGSNRLLLFALELSLRIEDIHSVALNALTDGADDKKCDLVYVDVTLGKAIIAQGYMASDPSRSEAPAVEVGDRCEISVRRFSRKNRAARAPRAPLRT